MKHRYEALLVLNTQGREDTLKEVIDRLESEFQQEGAQIEQVQKMDKRPFFIRGRARLSAGYYVNFVFNAEPQSIVKLRSKFKLDPGGFIAKVYQRVEQKEGKACEKDGENEVTWFISREWPVSIKSFCLEISTAAIRKCAIPPKAARCAISASRSTAFTQTEGGERREEVTFVDVVLWARLGRDRRRIFEEGQARFSSKAVSKWIAGMTSRPGKSGPNFGSSAKACSCWVAVPGAPQAKPPTKIEQPQAPAAKNRRTRRSRQKPTEPDDDEIPF